MSFPTDLTLSSLPLSEGRHYADCIIPKLPLTEGTYYIALSAGIDNRFADFVLNAAVMHVQDDDFFNVGKTISSNLKGKVVLCDHSWIVN